MVSSPNGTTRYDYDSRNRLSKTVSLETDTLPPDPTAPTTLFFHTPDGKKDSVTYLNGTDTKYVYRLNNRIQSIEHKYGRRARILVRLPVRPQRQPRLADRVPERRNRNNDLLLRRRGPPGRVRPERRSRHRNRHPRQGRFVHVRRLQPKDRDRRGRRRPGFRENIPVRFNRPPGPSRGLREFVDNFVRI